jgi:hypothetical protein
MRNSAVLAAAVCGLLSLPSTWLTVHEAKVTWNGENPGPAGITLNDLSEFLGGTDFAITGLNGHVTFGLQFPLWSLVALALAASGLLVLRDSPRFAVAPVVVWLVALAALFLTTVPFLALLTSSKASMGVGWLLAFASAALPFACLLGDACAIGRAPGTRHDRRRPFASN